MPVSFNKATVRGMLADLKRHDPFFENFGAGLHLYELNPPLPQSEIEAFETKHHVTLPEDYRQFIAEIGNGGAGPYYGVFPFGEHDDSDDFCTWDKEYLVGDLSAKFPHQDKWNLPDSFWDKMPDPGPDISAEEEDLMMEVWDKQLEEHYWNPKIMNGAIPICHLGCNLRDWLVINGPQKGFIWADARTDHLGVYPLRDGVEQLTFFDWYMSWLHKPRKV